MKNIYSEFAVAQAINNYSYNVVTTLNKTKFIKKVNFKLNNV